MHTSKVRVSLVRQYAQRTTLLALEQQNAARNDLCFQASGARTKMERFGVCFPFAGDIPVGGGHPSAMLVIRNMDPAVVHRVVALHAPGGPAGQWLAAHAAGIRQARFETYAGGLRRNKFRDLRFIVRESRRLAAFLRKERLSIVHVNDIWMFWTWILAARLAGAKLVWHHRSGVPFTGQRRLAFRLADRVIAVSRFAAGRYADHPKCVVIDNPFELPLDLPPRATVRAALLEELGLAEPVCVLGFFANLNRPISHRKRPLLVVEALERLAKLAPESTFVATFYGTVTEEFARLLRERAESLGVGPRVFLMGFRSPPEPALLASDVVLTPAVDEGFGRVPIEAMLLGIPVIASESGNHPSLVHDGETGRLVPPDDPETLAAAILDLAGAPERRQRIVLRAREEAERRFGVGHAVQAVSAVYAGLFAEERDRTAIGRSLGEREPG